MAKASGPLPLTTTSIESNDVPAENVALVLGFFGGTGVSKTIPDNFNTKDFYSDLVRGILRKPHRVQGGRVTCLFSVEPSVTNFYGSLHGGAVAAVAELVSIACARTVVAEDKEIFLGELSISYLSAAPQNAEVIVDGSVVRAGRNLTVVQVQFKLKETGKLVYTAGSTFYNMPIAKM